MEKKFYGYKAMIAGFFLMFGCYGSLSMYNILMPDLLVRANTDAVELAFGNSCSVFAGVVLGFTVAKAYKLMRPVMWLRLSIVGYLLVGCSAAFATSVYVCWAAWLIEGILITYGLYSGTTAYMSSWFIAGMTLGSAASGAAFGLFSPALGIRTTAIGVLLVSGIIGIVAGFFMKSADRLGQKPLGWETVSSAEQTEETMEQPGMDFKAVLRHPAFYLGLLSIFVLCQAYNVQNNASLIITQAGYTLADAALRTTLMTLLSGAMGLVAGRVLDKLGRIPYFVAPLVCLMTAFTCFYLGSTSGAGLGLFTLGACLLGLALGFYASWPSQMAPMLFGTKDVARMTPIFVIVFNISSFLRPFTIPVIAREDGNWERALLVAIGIVAAALVIGLAALVMTPYKPALERSKKSEEVA